MEESDGKEREVILPHIVSLIVRKLIVAKRKWLDMLNSISLTNSLS